LLAHPADEFVAGFVGSDRTLKRLRLIRVREVMVAARGEARVANQPTVTPDDDLRRVATLFLEHGLDELACIGADGTLVGRVTRAAVAARLAAP
jgi:osmoprotectant transport system ATP-binding protein